MLNPIPMAIRMIIFNSRTGMMVRRAVIAGDRGRDWFLIAAVTHSSSLSGTDNDVKLAW